MKNLILKNQIYLSEFKNIKLQMWLLLILCNTLTIFVDNSTLSVKVIGDSVFGIQAPKFKISLKQPSIPCEIKN